MWALLLKNAHPLEPFLDMSLHGSKTSAWQRSNGVHLVRMENEKQKRLHATHSILQKECLT